MTEPGMGGIRHDPQCATVVRRVECNDPVLAGSIGPGSGYQHRHSRLSFLCIKPHPVQTDPLQPILGWQLRKDFVFTKGKPQIVLTALSALLALTLTACGDSSTDTEDTDSTQDATVVGSVQTAKLSTKSIKLAQAQAPLTSASQPLPLCPWLSDASANAAVDNVMTSEPLVRRAVTPDECKWNVNAGFALSIRSVPLAEAASPASVTYNMDVPPVLEPQSGPGNDAVVILDPTWDASKPRPFAFVFNADDRQFKITTTGVRTSVERLRAIADEIVHALTTTAPLAEAKDAEPTLDPCVYEDATVAALFSGKPAETFTQKPHLPTSSCSYSGSVGNTRIDLTIRFSGDPLVPPTGLDPKYALIDKFGADVYVKDVSRTAGYGSSARAYQISRPSGQIRVDLKVTEETFPDDIAELILKNLIARTN